MGGFGDQRVMRGHMIRFVLDVEHNIEHLRSDFDGWADNHGCKRGSK